MKKVREIVIYDVPFNGEKKPVHIQNSVLKFPSGKTIDLGSLCYLDRDTSKEIADLKNRRKKGGARKVNVKSLDEDRANAIRRFADHISDEFTLSGNRAVTIQDRVLRFVPFMDWVDENNIKNVLIDEAESKLAFRKYVQFLRERVNTNEMSVNGATSQQSNVLMLLEGFFNNDEFRKGINLLRVSQASKVATSPPDEASQSQLLQLCNRLFDDLASFVLEFKKYPHQLDVPAFVIQPDNKKIWIFPTGTWVNPSGTYNKERGSYNYSEGRITTSAEMRIDYPTRSDHCIYISIKKAEYQISRANNNFHDINRLREAVNAMRFFIVLFLSETGMNWSQIINLSWSDDFEIQPSRQLFRTIKWRANNKDVSFQLPAKAIPKFKKFLSLRQYVLQGNESQWLFFDFHFKKDRRPQQTKSTIHSIYDILKKIYPDLKNIGTRQWRVAKSDWLVRNTDPATAALILQNSEKTVVNSYSEGSETSQVEEMSHFFNEVSRTVLSKEIKSESGLVQSLGICSEYGAPAQIDPNRVSLSNCDDPEGCLFCEKLKVHADEIDTRKLLSCKFCIQQTAHLTQASPHYAQEIEPVLERINQLLLAISEYDSELVKKVTEEVEVFGDLDPYWARKFEMLIELELIND